MAEIKSFVQGNGGQTKVDLYLHDGSIVESVWGEVGNLGYTIDYFRFKYPTIAHYLVFWDQSRIALGQGYHNPAWCDANPKKTASIIDLTHHRRAAEILLGEQLSSGETGWLHTFEDQ